MKNLLIKNIKWLIIIIVITTISWLSIFDILNAPKNYEKFQIFVSADDVNSDLLKTEILNNTSLKAVEIYKCSEGDTYYTTYLETSGIMSSDVLIVNKTLVEEKGATSSFIELDSSLFNKYNIDLNSFEVIKVEGKIHAIVVYDKEKNINLLEKYFTINEENKNEIYCLVLNNISYHIGDGYHQKDNITILAYEIISILLNNK